MDFDDWLDVIGEGGVPLLILLGALAGAVVVRRAARHYRRVSGGYGLVPSACGLSGEAVARRLLADCGLGEVAVVRSGGRDVYDPAKREVRLAAANFDGRSLAALAIAAHEVGHAQQFASKALLCRLRGVARRACLALAVVALGLLLLGATVVPLGHVGPRLAAIVAALVVLQAAVTLPLERDASRRGSELARRAGLIGPGEQGGFDRVLAAAWRTYLAAEGRRGIGLVLILVLTAVWSLNVEADRVAWGTDRADLAPLVDVALIDPMVLTAWAAVRLAPVVVIGLVGVSWFRSGARGEPTRPRRAEAASPSDVRAGLEEAVRRLDEVIACHPGLASAYSQRGFAHAQLGHCDQALADLDRALALGLDDAGTYRVRGALRLYRNDHDGAIADLGVATARAPGDATALRDLGLARLLLGDFDRALVDLDEAIRLDATDPVAFNNRGVARMKTGEYAGAIADLDEAIRLDPRFPNPLRHRAWLRSTCPRAEFRRGAEAVADASRAMELTVWTRVEWYDVLVAAHAEAGDFDEACKWQAKSADGPPPAPEGPG